MEKLLFTTLLILSVAFAVEMPSDTEQFYVVQGVFDELGIEQRDCEQQDDVINFACGQFEDDVDAFKQALADYIRLSLPGLYPATDWFENGPSIVRDYRSTTGQYLFAYNPDGYIVIAFTPK